MKLAIVAIEDKRFYEHRGVDVHGILRAVWQDVRHQQVVEGGSTITQQFVKNTYTKSQRSIGRKLKEAALAWQLEQRWSKDRILTAYLNTIYFGNGAYGVQQAALTYFHHSARQAGLGRGGAARRHPERPVALRPGHEPAGIAGTAGPRPEGDARPGRHHLRGVRERQQGEAAERGGHPPLGRAWPGAVLHELRPAAADRPLRRRPRLRRRAPRSDDDRPRTSSASRGRRSRSG